MAQIETWFNQDLKQAVKVHYIDGNVFSADNNGNIIGVNVFDDGEPASLGGTVSASIIRADGATVAATGTLSGNKVSVVLPQSAYVVPGVISIVLKLTNGTTVTTVLAVVGNVYQSTTDTIVDPGTIIPDINALIAEIEAAVASIPADYSDLWTSLAPAYSTSATYSLGQYVTYNGGLYRCISAITSGESWTAAHWAQTNIGGDVSDFKDEFQENNEALVGSVANSDRLIKTVELDSVSQLIAGKAINGSGAYVSNTGYCSKIMPVHPGEIYESMIDNSASGYFHYVCFFNSAGALLSRDGGEDVAYRIGTVPANAYGIAVSFAYTGIGNINSFYFRAGETNKNRYASEVSKGCQSGFTSKDAEIVFIDHFGDDFTYGKHLSPSDGSVTSGNGYCTVDFIYIGGADVVDLSVTLKTAESSYWYAMVYFYDDTLTFISRYDDDTTSTSAHTVAYVPANARYMKVTLPYVKKDNVDTAKLSAHYNNFARSCYEEVESIRNNTNIIKTISLDNVSDLIAGRSIDENGEYVENNGYSTKLLPVEAGQKYRAYMNCGTGNIYTYVAYYDANGDFVSRDGGQYYISKYGTVPSGVAYIAISFANTGIGTIISYFVEIGYENVNKNNAQISKANLDDRKIVEFINNPRQLLGGYAINGSGVIINETISYCTIDKIYIGSGAVAVDLTISKTAISETWYAFVLFYDESGTFISRIDNATTSTSGHTYGDVPANAVYASVSLTYCGRDTITGISLKVEYSQSSGSPKNKMIVFGDSISAGYFSITDEEAAEKGYTISYRPEGLSGVGAVWDTSLTHNYWGYANRWFLNRSLQGNAYPGQGYIKTAANNRNGILEVVNADLSDAGLIVVAWGFNDWHYNQTRGNHDLIDASVPYPTAGYDYSQITTINQAIWFCLGELIRKAPLAKIVVQTPMNGWLYGGDFASNWGIGYEMSNSGTLAQIHDDIKYWADYYGLQVLDMTYNNSIVNRRNIKDVLLDGSHPSDPAHQQLGRHVAIALKYC